MNPAGQSDNLPDVRRAEFVAMMRAFHVKISTPRLIRARQNRTRMLAGIALDFKEKGEPISRLNAIWHPHRFNSLAPQRFAEKG
jgi:hypothetical protein